MSAVVSYNQELEIIEAVLSGKMKLSDMQATRKRVLAFSEKHQIERILVNATGLERLPGTVSLYEFASSFWEAGFTKGARLGVVMSAGTSSDFRFMEDVAQNRAFMFRVFSTQAEAIQWLLA